jgi:hypothetical protein
VKPAGQRDDVMTERRLGHGVRHDRFDVFFAFRTVVPVDRVFGDHRLNVFGDVFDDPGARSRAALQRAAAVGTALQSMRFTPVDALRGRTPRPRVSRLGTRLFAFFRRGRFGIDRNHARRRGGCWTDPVTVQFCEPLVDRQGKDCHRLGTQCVKSLGRRLIELASKSRLDDPLQFCRSAGHAPSVNNLWTGRKSTDTLSSPRENPHCKRLKSYEP